MLGATQQSQDEEAKKAKKGAGKAGKKRDAGQGGAGGAGPAHPLGMTMEQVNALLQTSAVLSSFRDLTGNHKTEYLEELFTLASNEYKELADKMGGHK